MNSQVPTQGMKPQAAIVQPPSDQSATPNTAAGTSDPPMGPAPMDGCCDPQSMPGKSC